MQTTTLAFRFPWGLYHATPWGRNVNEGTVEWPPSPWRILRGLYATWRCRAPELDDAAVLELLGSLSAPPAYLLPEYGEGHTRHWMPDASDARSKVVDAFVVTERGAEVLVAWPVELSQRARAALESLAALLAYLGRAESMCEARLLESDQVRDEGESGDWLSPIEETGSRPGPETRFVRVLAPRQPLDIAALTARTTQVRGAGFLVPPGSQWVTYQVPQLAVPTRAPRQVERAAPTCVRWALAGPARPSAKAAVAVADVLRQACMARFGRRFDGAASPLLAGKDSTGAPLRGHGHAHYFAVDLDKDRLIDHVFVWVPAGLRDAELSALGRLDRLMGYGHISDFRPGRLGLEAFGEVARVAPEIVGPALAWRSHTPFAPPRHPKRRQIWQDFIQQQVTEELLRRSLPAPEKVRILRGDWLAHRRHRIRGRLEDARPAVGVEIVFSEPVAGPVTLGALSHFGLGLFLPDDG
ncbi:MAG: type I-G CRISPR-associated protein Csb2 [Actinomycetota bacterium]